MTSKTIRKKYFVHFSVQFKYILMSVLPALLMSIFCIYFVIKSGELVVEKEKSKLFAEFSSINMTIQQSQQTSLPKDIKDQIEILRKKLTIFKDSLGIQYYDLVEEWAKTKMQLLAVLFLVLVCVGVIALVYSHRIAGPIYRLKQSIEMLQEGKDAGRIKVRKADEFQDLADSLEKLRVILKGRGYLKP